jgi:hypothetical protein
MTPAAHSFSYVDTDIPEDMTIDMWRRRRAGGVAAGRSGGIKRLRRRVLDVARPSPAPRLRTA